MGRKIGMQSWSFKLYAQDDLLSIDMRPALIKTYECSQKSRHASTLRESKYSLRFGGELVITFAHDGSGRPY